MDGGRLDDLTIPLHSDMSSNFVSIDKYQDLVSYTRALQENLRLMNDRILDLEESAVKNNRREQHRQDMEDQIRGRDYRHMQEKRDRELGRQLREEHFSNDGNKKQKTS